MCNSRDVVRVENSHLPFPLPTPSFSQSLPSPHPPSPNPSPLPIPSLLQVYEEKEMLEARLELLSKTNMVPD